jgi:hypothetical protein
VKMLIKTLSTKDLADYIVEFARHPSITQNTQAALIFPSSRLLAASHTDIDELKLAVQYHKDVTVPGGLEYSETPVNFRIGRLSVRNAPLDSLFTLRGATYAFAIVDLTADPDYRELRNCFKTSMARLEDHPSVGSIVNWDRGTRVPL